MADVMPVGFHGKFCCLVQGDVHTWLIQSLVEATASHPVSEVPLSELDHHLDTNGWFDEGRKPTLRAIADHWKRMQSVDLSFPIIISKEFGLMDGMHRLMKAHATGQKTIKAVLLDETPAPDTIAPR